MEGAEGFNDWEQIQSPPPTAQSRHSPTSKVRIGNGFSNDGSIFPPSDHEGLQISPRPDSPSPPPPLAPHVRGPGERLRSHFRVLSSGIVQIASRFRCYAAGVGEFREFGSTAGGAVAALLLSLSLSLLCLWVHRWRRLREEEKNRLLLLLKAKDQKISQLLLQIAKVREMFSAQRRVPVIRIGGMLIHGQPT